MAIALKGRRFWHRTPGQPGRSAPDAEVSAVSSVATVLRLLKAAVLRYRARTAFALVLLVAAKLSVVAVPLVLKAIVDTLGALGSLGSSGGTLENPAALPVGLLLGYALLRFLGTLFGEIRDLIFSLVTQDTTTGFLLRAFHHLHRLSVRFHALRHTGSVTRDVVLGTQGIGYLLGVALFTVLPTLVEIGAVVFIVSFNYSLWFVLVILATFFCYTSFTVAYTEQRTVFQRALSKLDSEANGRLTDSLLNYETVKFYTSEQFEHNRFGHILGRSVDVAAQNQRALSILHIGQSAIIGVGVASVMLLAGQHVVSGTMTVGDLVLVNAYVIQVCLPLNSLGFVFRQSRDAIVHADKLFKLMEEKPEIVDAPTTVSLRVDRGEVVFDHVSFAYEPNRPILHDVSFTIAPGRTVAVVGGVGSGKSTLARLLFRFYDAGSGRVTIDGQNVRQVSQGSLRASIGVVPQYTMLFNDTIAYNIAYGRAGTMPKEVVDAAKAAHVHDFISSLPEGYDTLVGERGLKLSASQKQRIAIARAILKNPPILVLDEATSALDARSARAIEEELDRLARTRTTLVIARRLSTVVNADEILVLEHGYVVERGNHEQLLAANGIYARMWRLQRDEQDLAQVEEGYDANEWPGGHEAA
ncbi:MAG TPA: ABC transporter ATP-binding protein/permease [Rhodocyclaceae bacterium]|nr:ABC transporter ATP-binding protein/permease [Rhodocyclaceae bacterium]